MNKILTITLAVLTIIVAIALTLAGCGKQLAKHKTLSVFEVESNFTRLYQMNENRRADFKDLLSIQKGMIYNATNQDNFNATSLSQGANQQVQLELQLVMLNDLDRRFTNFIASFNRMSGRTIKSQITKPGSIPKDVEDAIRAKAEDEWPGDYTMQDYVIRSQTADWRKVNP